jgi:hypothetical protein
MPGYDGLKLQADSMAESSAKARTHIRLTKVNNRGKILDLTQVIRGTGVYIEAQYNPETLKYGKKVANKENNAAGEYSPPVELLGGNANTLSFLLRLNAYGEAEALGSIKGAKKLNDMYAFMPYSKVENASVGDNEFHNIDVIEDLYRRLVFLESLQYPNPVKVAGKFLRTPLVKIIIGGHLPLVWILDNINFDVKMFDPDLNIQRADVNVSFKMADCFYNEAMFKGNIKSLFFNMDYYRPLKDVDEISEREKTITAVEKYQDISNLITED